MTSKARADIVVSVNSAQAVKGLDEMAVKTDVAATEMDRKIGLASRSMGKNLTRVGTLGGKFGVPMASSAKMIGSELDKTGTKVAKFGGAVKQYGGIAALAIAGIAAVAIKSSLAAGAAFQASQDTLATAVKATGASWDSSKASVQGLEYAQERLGFSAIDVAKALGVGVVGTQSLAKSTKYLTIAENLAAYKHIDLSEAMLIVIKASQGQSRALKQLGIDLPIASSNALKLSTANIKLRQDTNRSTLAEQEYHSALANLKGVQDAAITKTYTQKQKASDLASAIKAVDKAHLSWDKAMSKTTAQQQKTNQMAGESNQIIGALSNRLKGQAVQASQTYEGKMRTLNAQFSNLRTIIGQGILPFATKLVGALSDIVSIGEGHNRWQNFLNLGHILEGIVGGAWHSLTNPQPDTSGPQSPAPGQGGRANHAPPGLFSHPPKKSAPIVAPSARGGDTYHVNVNVHGADPQAVVNALKRYNQHSGAIPVRIA